MDNQTLITIGIVAGTLLVAIMIMAWERRGTLKVFAEEWGKTTREIVKRLPESVQAGIELIETGTDKAQEIAHKIPLPEKVRESVDFLEDVVDDFVGEGDSEPTFESFIVSTIPPEKAKNLTTDELKTLQHLLAKLNNGTLTPEAASTALFEGDDTSDPAA